MDTEEVEPSREELIYSESTYADILDDELRKVDAWAQVRAEERGYVRWVRRTMLHRGDLVAVSYYA